MKPEFRHILTMVTPFILAGLVGSILESNFSYLIKIFLFIAVSTGLNVTTYTAFDER